MEFIAQSLEDVLATLRPLVVEWQDDTARRVIAEIEALPVKSSYTVSDLKRFLDILIERLRSGRGSAISGQRRGRSVEDFVEAIVRKVFGNGYAVRCKFTTGQRNKTAKCDIA